MGKLIKDMTEEEKTIRRQYYKDYYQKNLEKLRKAQLSCYHRHKNEPKKKEYIKQYQEKNKEHIKTVRKQYKEKNKESIRKKQKEYNALHKEEHRLRRIKFYKENPDYNKKYSQGCRHTLQGRIYAMYKHMEINHKKKGFDVNLIIPQQDFFDFASNNDKLKQLFNDWVDSNFDRKITPSIDRINFKRGYEVNNLQFLSMVDNLKKMHKEYGDSLIKNRKKVKISKNGSVYCFNSHKELSLFFGVQKFHFDRYLDKDKLYKGYKIESFNEGDDA